MRHVFSRSIFSSSFQVVARTFVRLCDMTGWRWWRKGVQDMIVQHSLRKIWSLYTQFHSCCSQSRNSGSWFFYLHKTWVYQAWLITILHQIKRHVSFWFLFISVTPFCMTLVLFSTSTFRSCFYPFIYYMLFFFGTDSGSIFQ